MDTTYWHKQTPHKPLFPELQWSRPETKTQAGRLLLIGGNLYGFAAPGEAYAEATKAGVGQARVLLPNALQKTLGSHFSSAEFAPSTPSGGFNRQASGEFLANSAWASATLLAGDFGRNSETGVLIEGFMNKYTGSLIVTDDAVESLYSTPLTLLKRPNTVAVVNFGQLQHLMSVAHIPLAFTLGMNLAQLVDRLHQLTSDYQCGFIVKQNKIVVVTLNGQVSTTELAQDHDLWQVKTAAHAAVWWLQNPTKPFEALSSAIFELE